jgi:hypothetical protein
MVQAILHCRARFTCRLCDGIVSIEYEFSIGISARFSRFHIQTVSHPLPSSVGILDCDTAVVVVFFII